LSSNEARHKKIEIMKNLKNINDILDSEEFNQMFDLEAEKKEIEAAGWTMEEVQQFGNDMAKQIK
jgi:hypothetical protein